jgi:hypothetical protein
MVLGRIQLVYVLCPGHPGHSICHGHLERSYRRKGLTQTWVSLVDHAKCIVRHTRPFIPRPVMDRQRLDLQPTRSQGVEDVQRRCPEQRERSVPSHFELSSRLELDTRLGTVGGPSGLGRSVTSSNSDRSFPVALFLAIASNARMSRSSLFCLDACCVSFQAAMSHGQEPRQLWLILTS